MITERLLFGPGPSMVSARVMSALSRPVLGHLDPVLLATMDDLRARLARVFRAPAGSRVLAVSGTGTAAMETAIANLIEPGKRVLVAVSGYFGLRLAEIARRYGAEVQTVECEWGRAIDPAEVGRVLGTFRADIVMAVHAETSTGVRNPIKEIAALARAHGALMVADCVTSLGGQEVDMAAWGVDVAYSGAQKCLGAPSGLAPVAFAPAAIEKLVACRSFYFDLGLLEDYWAGRKYHHTICSPLVFAFHEALAAIEEEGLEVRWQRHVTVHQAFARGIGHLGLSFLVPESDRLMTLNTVRVPEGVNEAEVRTALRERFSIEIGAGMGPLAGKIWRIGLMGASASEAHVHTLVGALRATLPH
jgi:alanine-glyoxylate transaminase/serine-glyoxylate transaminase/serine-pyruvate transaminase